MGFSRWRIMLFLLGGLVHSAAYANAPIVLSSAEQQWVREHPVVRYSIDPYWPLEYLENGEHKGLTRDYLNVISQMTGLTFELVPTANWTQTVNRLATGDIDLTTAVSKALIDKKVASKLLLSDVFFAGSTVVITRTGDPVLFSPHKLNGKLVAVKGGGGYESYLRKNFPDIKLLLLNEPEMALSALAEQRADAVIGLDSVLQLIIARNFFGTLHISGVLSDMPVVSSMGVSPHSPELLSIINKALGVLSSTETSEIFDRWLEKTDYGAPSWATIFRYYQGELVLFGVLILLLAISTYYAVQAKKMAQRNELAKGEFLAMMSHEIRTPMNGVLSSVELLQTTRLTSSQSELASLASVSARNLLEMLDAVLDISKLEADKVSIECINTDLVPLAQGLADIHRLSIKSPSVVLEANLVGLDDVLIHVDPTRLRQIVSNLLSNAVKFTHQGRVVLDFNFHASGPGTGKLRVQVSDTGIGIDVEQQKNLFKAFAQADSSITRRYGGSGLGLSICKQLIELMGGRVYLNSEPGLGTSISFTLAVDYVSKTSLASHDDESADAVIAPEVLTYAQVLVLVVEDNVINQKTIRLQLDELGCRAMIVDNGTAALTLMSERHPAFSIVLLDCHLPDIDGYEVACRIRQEEQRQVHPRTPIIAISALTDKAHQLKCFESGMDAFLHKPLSLHGLKKLFALWLPTVANADVAAQSTAVDMSNMHDLFIITSREDVRCLRKALEADDWGRAVHSAHRLHGSALAVKNNEMIKLASELEALLREPVDTGSKRTGCAQLGAIEALLNSMA